MLNIEEAIASYEKSAERYHKALLHCKAHGGEFYQEEAESNKICYEHDRQLAAWLRELQERRKQPEKAQLSQEDTTKDATSDTISRKAVKYKLTALVNEFEEILAHIREREVDDSVCGLYEYDGAYIGQSGDWCNECPGFEKDDCFKLSDEVRKEWTEEIIKALPTARPEPHWIPVSERLPSKEERKEWIDNNLDGIGYLYPCLVTRYSSINPDRTKNNPYVAKHYFDGEDFLNAGEEVCSEYIIAWMPLPEPYQKGATP